MDHHCPFTNCCIGLLNERYFIAWVFAVWLGCLYGSILSWQPFILCIWGGMVNGIDSLLPLDLERCTNLGKACFILLLAACLLAFMTVLLTWHLFLISQVHVPLVPSPCCARCSMSHKRSLWPPALFSAPITNMLTAFPCSLCLSVSVHCARIPIPKVLVFFACVPRESLYLVVSKAACQSTDYRVARHGRIGLPLSFSATGWDRC
jgi:hypothetical protein